MILSNKYENRITGLLDEGVNTNVYPGAVLLIAREGKISFLKEAGFLSTGSSQIKVKTDTVFDLASLTKPFATTLAVMDLVDKGKIHLDQCLCELLPCSVPDDKQNIPVRFLLSHSSGLPGWKPYYLDLVKHNPEKRKDILRQRILNEPLVYSPGTDSVYSDLGFMLLEWIIEACSGKKMDDLLTSGYYKPLGLKRTFLIKKKSLFSIDEIAATEDCPWRKKIIHGEVHDENAYAMGEYSGHAGLFGTAEDLFVILNMLRGHYYLKRSDFFKPKTVQGFFRKQNIVKNSSWALGWDTPSPSGSSSGDCFSKKSIGHLGFTGTSVWMDLERDIMVILLSNRVHKTRENIKIRAFRPRLHNLIMEAYCS